MSYITRSSNYDDDGIHKEKIHCQNRGVHTNSCDCLDITICSNSCECLDKAICSHSLQNMKNHLVNVIELMGPETPHYKSTTTDSPDYPEIELKSTKFENRRELNPISDSCENTPRDFSELSTYPTDSYGVISTDYRCPCDYPRYAPAPQYVQHPQYNGKHAQHTQTHKKHVHQDVLNKISCWFGTNKHKSVEKGTEPMDLYKINIIENSQMECCHPRRVIFDLIDGIPKPDANDAATNTQAKQQRDMGIHAKSKMGIHAHVTNSAHKQSTSESSDITMKKSHHNKSVCIPCNNEAAKVDIYYFDHGNSAYYRTTDTPPLIMTEILAEKTEAYTNKFWAEVFGTIHIGFSFFTAFVLQFCRFVLVSLIRPLTVGLIQLLSDYFFKPFLAVLFNAIIQPPLIFLYNVATSIRDLLDPLAEGIGYFLREIAVVFKAIRFFEIKDKSKELPIKEININRTNASNN